jgi:NitT/TauT family transport system permease protein
MTQIFGEIICLAISSSYLILFWTKLGREKSIASLAIAIGKSHTAHRARVSILYWTSPVFLVSVLGVFSYSGLISPLWVPAPDQIAVSLSRLIASGVLFSEAAISIWRVLVGFSAASIVGVWVGLLVGSFVSVRTLLLPTNTFLRYIPPTAFISLLIVYFGIGETYKYAVIFFGVVFFIVQMVVDVVDDIDVRHIEMGRTCNFSNPEIFRRVIVPYAMPRVLDVLRINLSAAWTFLVAAEIIGADRGLGHLIAVSQRFLRIDDLYVGILSFGVIGIVTDMTLEILSRKLFRWYYVALGR